eukprot:1745083-Alexandrium_andersonii.AAC.1
MGEPPCVEKARFLNVGQPACACKLGRASPEAPHPSEGGRRLPLSNQKSSYGSDPLADSAQRPKLRMDEPAHVPRKAYSQVLAPLQPLSPLV